jgi:hypothetical protein
MSSAGDNLRCARLDIAIEEWVVEIMRLLRGGIMQNDCGRSRFGWRRLLPGHGKPEIRDCP